jgi:hypothetical protein
MRSTRIRARRSDEIAEALRGRVVDAAGSALGAVLISVPELDRKVTTGDDGTFAFASARRRPSPRGLLVER